MGVREAEIKEAIVTIKIFGVGGGGNNVLRRLAESNQFDSQLIAINTDARQLKSVAECGVDTLMIGEHLTRGLGTGGKVEIGQKAAIDGEEQIRQDMYGADMVFITAAMGGGVGTGAAPVVARIARDLGVLSIGIVTEPFSFEGNRKLKTARAGIEEMKQYMDALLVVKNDNLLKMNNKKLNMKDAFTMADETLRQAISCIVEIIQTTGIINVDFADAVTIFRQGFSSEAVLGTGEADTAVDAVKAAINNPLVDKDINGAKGIIVNITSSTGIPIYDVGDATQFLYENAHDNVNIIWGIVEDPEMDGRVRATVVATDFVDSIQPFKNGVFRNNSLGGNVLPINNRNFNAEAIAPNAGQPVNQQTAENADDIAPPAPKKGLDMDLPGFMTRKF